MKIERKIENGYKTYKFEANKTEYTITTKDDISYTIYSYYKIAGVGLKTSVNKYLLAKSSKTLKVFALLTK